MRLEASATKKIQRNPRAARFFALAPPQLLAEYGLNPLFLCLSAKVAASVPACLSASVRIGGAPDEEGLLALLN